MRKILIIILVIPALYFSATGLYKNIISAKNDFSVFYGKTLDEKYEVIDGDFYRFMVFCKSVIPAGAEVLFYNPWKLYDRAYGDRAFYRFEYERSKARFYLYPIKVHAIPYDNKLVEKRELDYLREEEMFRRVSYIIAYYPDIEFPGFKKKYTFDQNRYILVKE